MQAIITKYLGPTNARGARVVAKCQAGKVTVPWDHAKGVDENHAAACLALTTRLNWGRGWVGGAMPDDSGFAFVRIDGALAVKS